MALGITPILFTIIGAITFAFFWFIIKPNLFKTKGPIIQNPLWRRRPLLEDPDFGIAEIQSREYAGEGKIRLHLSNGEVRQYELRDIQPICFEDCLAGTERAIYRVARRTNNTFKEAVGVSDQADATRLKQSRDEDVLRILRRAKDIGEIAKPVKPGDQQQR